MYHDVSEGPIMRLLSASTHWTSRVIVSIGLIGAAAILYVGLTIFSHILTDLYGWPPACTITEPRDPYPVG